MWPIRATHFDHVTTLYSQKREISKQNSHNFRKFWGHSRGQLELGFQTKSDDIVFKTSPIRKQPLKTVNDCCFDVKSSLVSKIQDNFAWTPSNWMEMKPELNWSGWNTIARYNYSLQKTFLCCHSSFKVQKIWKPVVVLEFVKTRDNLASSKSQRRPKAQNAIE